MAHQEEAGHISSGPAPRSSMQRGWVRQIYREREKERGLGERDWGREKWRERKRKRAKERKREKHRFGNGRGTQGWPPIL